MSPHEPNSRPLLLGGPALGLRFIVLALMSAGLMVADHRQHHLAVVRDWLSAVAYPFQWTVQAPLAAWTAARESFASRSRIEADNVRLAADNFLLRLRMMRFESLEQENRRLRAAGESTSRVVQRTLIAEIVRVDLDPFRQRVLVNKGSRNGVFRGQAVLDANGVFGQVMRAGPVSAEVILISDPEHAIPVQINRTGTRSIALGTGRTGMLSLPYLPQNADVVDGDLLVSSGLGGVYPPGYPVGKVTSVVRDPSQPLLMIEAEPLAGLDRDPEVLLVWFDNAVVEPEPGPEPDPQPAAESKPAESPAPAEAPPVTEPPAEEPPAGEPPVQEPPVQEPPVVEPPPAEL
ncbi:MAG: rod shape-determining protein MreC [Pseudomonadota bacterium]|nr:rod shape-determining protein MreC [Pseudomonadota bacterium]